MHKNEVVHYSDDQFMQDFGRVSPWAIAGLRSHGALTECAACGSAITSPGFNVTLSDGRHSGIHSVCDVCIDRSPVQKILDRQPVYPANYIVVPETSERRLSFAQELVFLAAEYVAEEYGLPIVRRPLFCDGLLHSSEAFIYNKFKGGMGKARTVVPWEDDDPLFMVGRAARDAELIRESILNGESEVTLLRGGGVLMTGSEKLFKAMQADHAGGANHG